MTQRISRTISDLVALEEKDWPSAKSILEQRGKLREKAKSLLFSGEAPPENSPFYAELREMPGRVPYKSIVERLVSEQPEGEEKVKMEEEVNRLMEEYRGKPSHRLAYGRKEPLTQPPESKG